jgi:signal transduction histidine kinase
VRLPRSAPVPNFLSRFKNRLARIPRSCKSALLRLVELFKIRAPATAQVLQRIQRMERDIVLPIKVAAILLLLYQFYFTHWVVNATRIFELSIEYAHYFLWFWICTNLAMGWVLFRMWTLRPPVVELAVFLNNLADGIFLGVLTLVTGGYGSILYWVFLALIARTAVSVPRATSQLLLNLTLSACYILAGVFDSLIAERLDPADLAQLDIYSGGNPAEPLLLRLALLLLMTIGCYGIQVLLERQRQVEEEAREFAVREVQLRSAGRLAAEFAHQIKNPLAIINNAVFSLQKAFREGKSGSPDQIRMIQEEVERADRIITEVMGYAQLSEGHVERLNVIEELDDAIDRVFPPAAGYPIHVHREYGHDFPPLVMHRRHVSEAFINVLQNAREALAEYYQALLYEHLAAHDGSSRGFKGGHVFIKAACLGEQTIEVSIADDGPGIAPENLGRIFEAYYTTKEKGTGLGLATVKHNLELYGGSVRVESELGKGACFTLTFPAKTLVKLATS